MISFNGSSVGYDYIGNITAFNGMTFDWEGTRQLKSITAGDNVYSYTYNEDGLRTSKNRNGGSYEYYFWNGTQLSAQLLGASGMYFRYDEAGRPMSITYNNATYYYVLNQQGDVVGLKDVNGTTVVNYEYDAWGNILSITGASGNAITSGIGISNPFRYRGYYYDNETKLYYLQSRYYSPELRRFICGDVGLEILEATVGDVLGANLFVYCMNNPVMYVDPTGRIYYEGINFTAELYAKYPDLVPMLLGTVLKSIRNAKWYGSVIFAIEGTTPINKGGRIYGADFIVVTSSGKIKLFTVASTLPDRPNEKYNGHYVATLCEGVYRVAKKTDSYKKTKLPAYKIMRKENLSESVPVTRKKYTEEYGRTATGMLIHAGGDGLPSANSAWSAGCLLVYKDYMKSFSSAVGLNAVLVVLRY